jgi:predicted nuclease of restriction endonuclease-like (RecB) superfamily
MNNLTNDNEYKNFIVDVATKIKQTQVKLAVTVNRGLLHFYFELGGMISQKQQKAKWGARFIENIAKDIKKEFPELRGFSRTNLFSMKKFYEFYSPYLVHQAGGLIENAQDKLVQLPVGLIKNHQDTIVQLGVELSEESLFSIPWRHHIEILNKVDAIDEAIYYITQTMQNNWSKDILAINIKSKLFQRDGKGVNNFLNTLPKPLSDLAVQTIKDPYVFDFFSFDKPFIERDIENKLIDNITKFLLELGKGFAFVGKQYHLEIARVDRYIDLLFYHIELKCYVVIELKNKKFIPEYAGKLNYYISAVDTMLKKENDNPTIGILLCRDKNNIEAEFALRDINKPIGVSEFELKLTEILPENLRSSLPTIEEFEAELGDILEDDE